MDEVSGGRSFFDTEDTEDDETTEGFRKGPGLGRTIFRFRKPIVWDFLEALRAS